MESPTDDAFTQQSETFMSWLVSSQNAVVNPKIALTDLRRSGAGRGVVALSPLDKDEAILKIPRSSVLTVETSELSRLIPNELSTLDPWLSLILVLIFETRPSSPWRPYIDLLPTTFDTLMFWTPQELSALQGSAVLGKVGKQEADELFTAKLLPVVRGNMEMFGESVLASASSGTHHTSFEGHFLSVVHRMASIIMSYSFDLEEEKAMESSEMRRNDGAEQAEDEDSEEEGKHETEHYKAMVPFADMLNAEADLNNCRLYETPTTLEMRTLAPVDADSELFNDYGPLPRSDLLRRYGYITPNYAQYDVVEISSPFIVDIAGENLSAEDKRARVECLLDEGILEDSFDLDCSFEVPEELVVIVRTMLLSQEEFQASKDRGGVEKLGFTEKVGLVLVRILEARLTDYPTSVQEDRELLAGNRVVEGRERSALEVRLGEKMILEGTLRDIRRRIQKKRERPDETNHRKRARPY